MTPILFPEPREIHVRPGHLSLHDAVIRLGPDAAPLERQAATLVATALAQRRERSIVVEGGATVPDTGCVITIESVAGDLSLPTDPQGYVLLVDERGVRLRGASPAGALHGAQTLCQLIAQHGLLMPSLAITDWPNLRHRGLFVECKWGPDRMTLDDWKAAIDASAALKFNHLGVGLYGCWVIQYDNAITEFLMVPLPDIPGAATPKTIRYYSPAAGTMQVVEYLPEMFKDDFFGQLVAYGRSHGVTVRPQFNSLGHNTLIPRLVPAVSARDDDGNPTGYGYCLSAPETDRLVFSMYDRILDTYLLPHGVTSFHIGLDEVWPSAGIDPSDPHRVVEPWCRCPRCRHRRPEDLFVDWLLRLCVHLKEHGVEQIAIWNDQLTRHMDLLDADLARRIVELGLGEHVVIEWWWYHTDNVFPTLKPELGLKSWVVPMTGYYHWWPYQSYLENIQAMLAVGVTQGSEGTESYCTFDRGFDRHYRYLAEWAWNPAGTVDLQAFRVKYARGIFGEQWEQGLAALEAFDRVIPAGDTLDLIRALMPYRYTYVAAEQPYPRRYPLETIGMLRSQASEYRRHLGETARQAAYARAAFLELAPVTPHAWQFAAEAHRIGALASIFLTLLNVDALVRHADPGNMSLAAGQVRSALAQCEAMMADLEAVKDPYLLPQMLRDLTTLRTYLTHVLEAVAAATPGTDVLTAAITLGERRCGPIAEGIIQVGAGATP